jgi:hypothetical protein
VSRVGRAWTIVATLPLLAGCDGTYDLPAAVRWESEHFVYQTRAGDSQICPDVLGPLEQHFALLQGYLGFEWAPGAKVTYEKMLNHADYLQHGGCPMDSGACTDESMVVSASGMDLHELVHAYLDRTGFPPPVLVEGAAVALACIPAISDEGKPKESWDQLAGLNYVTTFDEVYHAGGWLVGYLLRQYDPRLFTTLYGRLPSDADAGTMDAAFRDVYGQSLAAIWAAALADTAPHQVCLWQCSQSPVPLDGTPVATDRVCGLDVFHSLAIASTSVVGITSTGAEVYVESCDQTPLGNGFGNPGVLNLYDLPPGSYYVVSSGDPGTMTLDGSLSSLLTPTCAEATDLALFAGFTDFSLTGTAPGPSAPSVQWFLPLPPPPAGTWQLSSFGGGPAVLKVCGSCDPASCVGQLQFDGWTWAPGQTVSVEVDPDPSDPSYRISLDWLHL